MYVNDPAIKLDLRIVRFFLSCDELMNLLIKSCLNSRIYGLNSMLLTGRNISLKIWFSPRWHDLIYINLYDITKDFLLICARHLFDISLFGSPWLYFVMSTIIHFSVTSSFVDLNIATKMLVLKTFDLFPSPILTDWTPPPPRQTHTHAHTHTHTDRHVRARNIGHTHFHSHMLIKTQNTLLYIGTLTVPHTVAHSDTSNHTLTYTNRRIRKFMILCFLFALRISQKSQEALKLLVTEERYWALFYMPPYTLFTQFAKFTCTDCK
jgi:hypothetical protein